MTKKKREAETLTVGPIPDGGPVQIGGVEFEPLPESPVADEPAPYGALELDPKELAVVLPPEDFEAIGDSPAPHACNPRHVFPGPCAHEIPMAVVAETGCVAVLNDGRTMFVARTDSSFAVIAIEDAHGKRVQHMVHADASLFIPPLARARWNQGGCVHIHVIDGNVSIAAVSVVSGV